MLSCVWPLLSLINFRMPVRHLKRQLDMSDELRGEIWARDINSEVMSI